MSRRRTRIVIAAALVACHAAAQAGGGAAAEGEGRLLDWIRTFWPIVVVFGGMVVAAVLVGLGTRFVSSAAFEKLRARVDAIELDARDQGARLRAVEKSLEISPTRAELQEDIGELGERMMGVEVGLKGIGGQLETTNVYLHTLLERGLKGAA